MPRESQEGPTIEQLLTGILALLAAERDGAQSEAADGRKTEIILHGAGIPPHTIARVMGKNVGAVRKTIERSR